MRIALLNNLFGDNARGGAEQVVAVTARALMELGHQVRVLRTAAADATGLWHGVSVTSLGPVNGRTPYEALTGRPWGARLGWQLRHLADRRMPDKTLAALAMFRPTVVHTHNLMGFGFQLPHLLGQAGYRHVHTLHDVQLLHPSGWQPAGRDISLSAPARAYAAVTRRLFGSPAVVTAPSRFLLEAHQRYGFFGESATQVLANPVVQPACVDRVAPDKPVYLFVGQLNTHKGLRLLLHAWEQWTGAEVGELWVAGDGPLRPLVTEAADRLTNVRYLGYLSNDNLQTVMRQAAFLVVPSTVLENLPLVAAEALVSGLPVIAAQNGGLPEMVREGRTGFLFMPGDSCSLRDTLNRALAAWQGRRWTVLSGAARRAGQTMGIVEFHERLLALYQK